MKRIYRSEEDKFLGGVCGGLAEIFKIDPTFLRLGLVAVFLLTGIFPILIIYFIAWIIIPKKSELPPI